MTTPLKARATRLPERSALGRAEAFQREALASEARRKYRQAAAAFARWCETEGATALLATPNTIAAFLAAEADAGRSVSGRLGQFCTPCSEGTELYRAIHTV